MPLAPGVKPGVIPVAPGVRPVGPGVMPVGPGVSPVPLLPQLEGRTKPSCWVVGGKECISKSAVKAPSLGLKRLGPVSRPGSDKSDEEEACCCCRFCGE